MDRYNSRMFSTSLAHSDRPASGPIYRAQFLKQGQRELPRQSAPPAASKWLERKLRPPSRPVHEPDLPDVRHKEDNSKDSEENRALQSLALDYVKLKRSVAALEKRISLLQAERPDGPTQPQLRTLHKQDLNNHDQDHIKHEQIEQIDQTDQIDQIGQINQIDQIKQLEQELDHAKDTTSQSENPRPQSNQSTHSHRTTGNAQLTNPAEGLADLSDQANPTPPLSPSDPSNRAAATESLWHRTPGSKAAVLALAWAVGMLAVALLLQ